MSVLIKRRFWSIALRDIIGMDKDEIEAVLPELLVILCVVPLLLYITAGLWSEALMFFLSGRWLLMTVHILAGLFFLFMASFGFNHIFGSILCKLIRAAWMTDDRKHFLDGMHFLEDDDTNTLALAHWTDTLCRLSINRVFRGYYFPVWRYDFDLELEPLFRNLDVDHAPEWVVRKHKMYLLMTKLEQL